MNSVFAEHQLFSCAEGRPSIDHTQGQGYSPQFIDRYEQQLLDALRVQNPALTKGSSAFEEGWKRYRALEGGEDRGNWVFYPWLNSCVRVLEESLYQEVSRIDPQNWWSSMATDTLELLIYGEDLQKVQAVEGSADAVQILSWELAPNPAYLYLTVWGPLSWLLVI